MKMPRFARMILLWEGCASIPVAGGLNDKNAAHHSVPASLLRTGRIPKNTPVLYDTCGRTASSLVMHELLLMAHHNQLHLVFQVQFQFFECDFLNQVF